jgi:hypothetical protein
MLVALPVLCLALSLTACSGDGDDDKDKDKPGETPSASDGGSESTDPHAPIGDIARACEVEVEVSGAVEDSWEGEAQVRVTSDGERAVYEAENGDARIAAYSAGGDFDTASANFSKDDATYTTPIDDKTGLKVKPNGKGATVDAAAYGLAEEEVQITATFTCGRTRIE